MDGIRRSPKENSSTATLASPFSKMLHRHKKDHKGRVRMGAWRFGSHLSILLVDTESGLAFPAQKRGEREKGRRVDCSAGREGWRAGKRREVKERPPTRDISPRSHQTSPYNNPHLSSASSSLGSNMPNEYWNPEHPPGSTETRRRRGEPPRCVLRWVMRCTNHTHTHTRVSAERRGDHAQRGDRRNGAHMARWAHALSHLGASGSDGDTRGGAAETS